VHNNFTYRLVKTGNLICQVGADSGSVSNGDLDLRTGRLDPFHGWKRPSLQETLKSRVDLQTPEMAAGNPLMGRDEVIQPQIPKRVITDHGEGSIRTNPDILPLRVRRSI
jgi:hypothetical protein